MLIQTKCECCAKGVWEDEQSHVCACGAFLCAKCADLGPGDADTNPTVCPVCVNDKLEVVR